MSNFDDAADPELGAACNRLAAYVLPLPEGEEIDPQSGLTESDLVLILRHLHATRKAVQIEMLSMGEAGRRYGHASVPITAKDKS
jgi:hypothetical protein